MMGRRRPDMGLHELPDDMRAGDYWKILEPDGSPRIVRAPGKLTAYTWHVCAPILEIDSEGLALGRLDYHTVREHEDGTISVRPGDGSSNSILIDAGPHHSWHGYIEKGFFRRA
jgi:hypothetical protein